MGYEESSKGKEKATSREQELADMLLKLTHPASLPQPSQLHAQAETIASLICQRDFLVKRSFEERERWDAERESWTRVAQALFLRSRKEISQLQKEDPGAQTRHTNVSEASSQSAQEIERINALLHNEKKFFQQKLTEAQSRLAALESELVQLKPFLLFHHPSQLHAASSRVDLFPNVGPETPRPGTIRWNEISDYEADSDEETPQMQSRPQFRNPVLRPVGSEVAFPSLQQSPQKSKGRRDISSPAFPPTSNQTPKTPRKKSAHVRITTSKKPLLSDARMEHLLLAARKVGTQRATYLSGIYSQPYSPPEPSSPRKRRRTASPSKPQQTPKTPRRTGNASTPLLTRTPLDTSSAQPRTPLQSLLSVAQSVLSDPGKHSLAPQESPLAKRQKLDYSSSLVQEPASPTKYKGKEKQSDTDPPQFKSALDFLADQAEVYGSKSGSRERDEPPSAAHGDLEMEDASGSTDHEANETGQDQEAHSPKVISERLMDEVPETQQTGLGSFTQDESQSFMEVQPSLSSHRLTSAKQNTRSKSSEDRSSATTSDSLTLAPAIDLTPTASHSPGPQDLQRRSRHRSRSHSVDKNNEPGPFPIFSLGRQQLLDNLSTNGTEKSTKKAR